MKKIFTLLLLIPLVSLAQNSYDGIFISEYLEGTSNYKALEIFNASRNHAAVPLNRLRIRLYANGSTTASTTNINQLSTADDGTTTSLAYNEAFVIYINSASSGSVFSDPATQLPNAPANRRQGVAQSNTALNYNGDDAVELQYDTDGTGNWVTVDIFGKIGEDPGSFWSANGVQTQDRSLERKSTVNIGVSTSPATFDPSVEWTDNGNITNPITTLGQHSVASPLPLSLVAFNAVLNNNNVNVTWTATNEINVAGYAVERSMDGRNFASIANVPVMENGSTTTKDYSYVDNKVAPGTNYYRLKMMDKDGSFKYSQIISVKAKTAGLSVYPNPVRTLITLQHEAAVKGAMISVIDFSGKQIMMKNVETGATQTSIDAAKLVPGSYMIVYFNNGMKLTKQFIKE